MQAPHPSSVDLYWIPLGAGGHSVRFNGRVFEAIDAARHHRPRCDLYHAALIVTLDGEQYTIELAPAWDANAASRGVVCTGAVGSRYLGWSRLFRYELRCWRGGSIPDLHYAVGGAQSLSSDPSAARRLLDVVAAVPTAVWGRDELKAGEMWNCNSVIAWLIATADIATKDIQPPAGRPRTRLEPRPARRKPQQPKTRPRGEPPSARRTAVGTMTAVMKTRRLRKRSGTARGSERKVAPHRVAPLLPSMRRRGGRLG